MGGLQQLGRSLQLALGMDHFGTALALGFGLLGDGPNHVFVEVNVFDLDIGHLDAPGVGLHVQHLLQILVDLLALGQQLVQLVLAQNGPQGGLCQLRCGLHVVFDLNHGQLRVHHTGIHHGIHLDRDVVPGDHVLLGHVHHHGAQVHPHHLLNARNQDDQARPLDLPEAPQLKHHAALVLAQNAHRGHGQHDQHNGQKAVTNLPIHHTLLEDQQGPSGLQGFNQQHQTFAPGDAHLLATAQRRL